MPQLALDVAVGVRDDGQAIDRRIVVEADADQRLPAIGRQLQPHRRIGPRLDENATQLLGIVGDAVRLLPFEGDPQEEIGDRPGVGDARLRTQIVGEAPDLAQHDRLVEIAAQLTKNIGAALHCRVPTRSRGESTATSSASAAEIQSTGRRKRGRAGRSPDRARSEPVRAIAAAPSAASTPASRTPETGTSTNGAAAATAAASAREIRRRPSGKCARRAATITKNAQIAAKPSGRKRARCRRGSGQSGPRLEAARRTAATPRPDSVSALDKRRLHPVAVGCVDEKPHAAAVLGEEPAERVGAPDDPLPGRLPLAFTLSARQHWPRARFAAAVDGDVEQPRRPEDGTHARNRRQLFAPPAPAPAGWRRRTDRRPRPRSR